MTQALVLYCLSRNRSLVFYGLIVIFFAVADFLLYCGFISGLILNGVPGPDSRRAGAEASRQGTATSCGEASALDHRVSLLSKTCFLGFRLPTIPSHGIFPRSQKGWKARTAMLDIHLQQVYLSIYLILIFHGLLIS